MAWIPASPETKQIPGPTVGQTMDRYQILWIKIIPQPPSVEIELAEGYDDGGAFKAHSHKLITVPDAKYPNSGMSELINIFTKLSDGAKTNHDNIRDDAYELLLALGEIPAGSPS